MGHLRIETAGECLLPCVSAATWLNTCVSISDMKTIFNLHPTVQRGFMIPPSWQQTRRGLTRNLDKVMEYYHGRNIAVKGQHLLVRLLNSAKVSVDTQLDRFYQIAVAQESNISHAFRLTSPILSGQVFDGEFYGKGSKEIIISSSDTFDVFEVAKHWKDQEPVRVLKHAKNDLQCLIPNGIPYSKNNDIAVISVNIPMLLVMFRSFVIEQIAAQARGHTPKSISQFVHSYVLANMLPSHLDQAIFNRFVTIATKGTMDKPDRKNAEALEDMDSATDKVLKEVLGYLKTNDMPVQDMFAHIPAVSAFNMLEGMRLPNNAPTRQYEWVEGAARLTALTAMAIISTRQLMGHDRDLISQVLVKMRLTSSMDTLASKLGPVAEEYKTMYDSLAAIVRK